MGELLVLDGNNSRGLIHGLSVHVQIKDVFEAAIILVVKQFVV